MVQDSKHVWNEKFYGGNNKNHVVDYKLSIMDGWGGTEESIVRGMKEELGHYSS